MKTFKTIAFWFVQMTWGFPQFIIGLIGFIILFPFTNHFIYKDAVYTVVEGNWGGVSFGAFIFVDKTFRDNPNYIRFINHERAHSVQSLILGMLWFFVIGIPSFLWAAFIRNIVNKRRIKKGLPTRSYYWFYTEAWAEKIADKYYS